MEESNLNRIDSIWRACNDFATGELKADLLQPSQQTANIYCPGHSFLYIVDFEQPQTFIYLSTGVQDALGIDHEELSLAQLVGSIHPKDAEHQQRCERLIRAILLEKISPAERAKYKFTYNLRYRHANGTYRLFLHQSMVYKQDEEGMPLQVLNVDTAIDRITSNNNYTLSVIGYAGAPSYIGIKVDGNTEIQTITSSEQRFTYRELEVIRRFAEGLTASEVGEALGISEGTVRTHRNNLIQKSGCKNMTAVVALAIREGQI